MGAPPEVASVLDEIRRESDHLICRRSSTSASTCMATADPELDAFMVSLSLSLFVSLVLMPNLIVFSFYLFLLLKKKKGNILRYITQVQIGSYETFR